MGTRSTIALEYADGQVGQIYCHWDGYLDNNGKILLKHYQDPFKLRELLDNGDMSSLDTDVDSCTFYKERGEDCPQQMFKDFADYVENHQYEEYEYILRQDGDWYVKCHSAPYVLLADAIANEMLEEELTEETLAS
jgi:hypothetical protein